MSDRLAISTFSQSLAYITALALRYNSTGTTVREVPIQNKTSSRRFFFTVYSIICIWLRSRGCAIITAIANFPFLPALPLSCNTYASASCGTPLCIGRQMSGQFPNATVAMTTLSDVNCSIFFSFTEGCVLCVIMSTTLYLTYLGELGGSNQRVLSDNLKYSVLIIFLYSMVNIKVLSIFFT